MNEVKTDKTSAQ